MCDAHHSGLAPAVPSRVQSDVDVRSHVNQPGLRAAALGVLR